jgi:hypothetical protein
MNMLAVRGEREEKKEGVEEEAVGGAEVAE